MRSKLNWKERFEHPAVYEKEGRAVEESIANVLRGSKRIDENALISASYVLLRAEQDGIDLSSVEAFCASAKVDEERKAFLEANLGDVWPMVIGQKGRYSVDALRSIILFHEERDARMGGEVKTPVSVSHLACKLFDFRENDEIADFCLGGGAFTTEAYLNYPTLRFYGVELLFRRLGARRHFRHQPGFAQVSAYLLKLSLWTAFQGKRLDEKTRVSADFAESDAFHKERFV